MARRLVVHVGPPKTGTTSIQHALWENEKVLRELGVYLPKAGRYELAKRGVVHHHLGWELVGSRKFRGQRGGWDELAAEIADVDADTVLVSSEILVMAMTGAESSDLFEARLRSLGMPVTIVYVVRDPLARLNSGYVQHVKMLEERLSFDDYVTRSLRSGRLDLEQQFADYFEAPGIDFVAVEFPKLVSTWPLGGLFEAAGIDVDVARLTQSPERSNVSLGPVGVEAERLLRGYLEGLDHPLDTSRLAIRQLHRVAARQCKKAGWCDDPYWGWDPSLAAHALDRLAPTNERFAYAVWGKPWPLEAPVDREPQRVRLMDLDVVELNKVHHFIAAMARRYVNLRRGPDSLPPAEDDDFESYAWDANNAS